MTISASARAASIRARQASGASSGSRSSCSAITAAARSASPLADQRLGGADDQLGEVDVAAAERRRVGEQLERLLVVVRRLVGAADRAGLVAGLDAGVERGVEVHGQPGVPGQLGGGAAAAALTAARRRTARAAAPARRAAGRRTPPRRAARAGRSSGRRRRPARSSRRPAAGPRRARRPSSPDAAASISWETLRPATLAARTTCRAVSSSRSSRTSSTSARSAGTQLPGPDGGADELLDEERVALGALDDVGELRLAHRASATSSAISARTASSGSGAELRARSTPRSRDHSATWRRSGWRRCRSSERYDATIATGPANGRENRKLSRSRVDWSAQWRVLDDQQQRSRLAAASSSACTASNRSARSSAATARSRTASRSPSRGARAGAGRGRGARSATCSTTSGRSAASRPRTSENGR